MPRVRCLQRQTHWVLLLLAVLLALAPATVAAAPAGDTEMTAAEDAPAAPGLTPENQGLTAKEKVALTRWVGVGAIFGWGLLQWDYGQQSPHLAHEGWFQHDTPEGGADKLGHLYTGYVLARMLGSVYRDWGIDRDRAAAEAALTSWLVTTTMELGDSFSPYGFSWEDMVMNAAGAGAGYALMRSETWRERLDIRTEYEFNTSTDDPSTDYENARYLLALKLGGFESLRDTPLKWLELHAGYYVRGYDNAFAPDERTLYAGLGLNLSALLRAGGMRRSANFLQFYQPPGTSLRADHEL
jgi:uncharacterized protein YfiM (DUF2279 family)